MLCRFLIFGVMRNIHEFMKGRFQGEIYSMFQKKSVEFTLGRYGWCASVFLAACLLAGCVTNFAFGAVTFSYDGNTRTLSGNGTYTTYLNFYSNLSGQPYAYNTYFDSSGGEIVLTLTNAMTGWSNAYGVDVTTAGGKNGNLMYEVRTGTVNLRGAYNYSASWLHFNIDSGATFRTTNRKWYDSTKTNGTNPKFFGSGTYEVYDDNYADWVFRNSAETAADGFCTSVGNLSYFTGTLLFRNIRVGISDAFATGQFQFYQNGSWGNWTLGVVDGGQLFVGYQSTTTTITRNLYLEGDNWGQFKNDIGPRRYRNLVNAMARVNLATIDAKVSIDLKRILRLPSSLHSKVSMKCMEVKNRETFDPFDKAVPKFVYERKGV